MPRRPSSALFTLGYQQRSLVEFVDFLRKVSVDVLIDVRETPWSHKPGFSKQRLARTLERHGIAYVHARFAGNPKRLRKTAPSHEECLRRYARHLDANPAVLKEFDEVVRELLAVGKRVCLTCYERHPDDCHRSILLERWRRKSHRTVRHLGADETCRLIRV